ncbi:MAG: cell division protein FtsQ/DivIB [Alphaproteobacteria bacterium]
MTTKRRIKKSARISRTKQKKKPPSDTKILLVQSWNFLLKHKKLSGVGGLGILGFILWFGFWPIANLSGLTPAMLNQIIETHAMKTGFGLEQLALDGRKHTQKHKIMEAITLTNGTPLFWIDLEHTKQELLQIDWIKQASIKRQWPNKLHITIQERQPYAIWQHQRQFFLVDPDGVAFIRQPSQGFSDLPLVIGQSANVRADEVYPLLDQLSPYLRDQFQAATLMRERYWMLHFNQGLRLKLPADRPGKKLTQFIELIENSRLDLTHFDQIDLRLEDRMIMRPIAPVATQKTAPKKAKSNIKSDPPSPALNPTLICAPDCG